MAKQEGGIFESIKNRHVSLSVCVCAKLLFSFLKGEQERILKKKSNDKG